jgi:hypothetical protein
MRRSDDHPQEPQPQPPAAEPQCPAAAGDAAGDLFSELFETLDRRQGERRGWDRRHSPPPSVASSTATPSSAGNGGSESPVPPQTPPPPQAVQSVRGPERANRLPATPDWQRFTPRPPQSLQGSGLTLAQLAELLVKQIYMSGSLTGYELAGHLRLPFSVIDEGLRFLKQEKCLDVSSGDLLGRVSYRFQLTELGRVRAKEAFEQCRYVGPAPVPLQQYVQQCALQTVAGIPCTPEALRTAFHNFIIRPGLLEELGPAVCSGKSIFIFGPPGNGKTMVAKGLGEFLHSRGGEIYIPYALQAENSIVTMYDPTIHQTTDDHELRHANVADRGHDPSAGDGVEQTTDVDLRWRRIRRPVVITGGELTLEMLDLRFNRVSNFYNAPLHIKANGGVFLIDDFGRQIVSPRDLLNRWILPLEERIDFLTLATGKKFSVPFEQLIIFSTNLDPRELVDQAFLRRIRHKIGVGAPERPIYTQIFQLCCGQRQIPYSAEAVQFLYTNFYDQGRMPRSSDPRDLLDIAVSICRFHDRPVVLTDELMADCAERFFCGVEEMTTMAAAM